MRVAGITDAGSVHVKVPAEAPTVVMFCTTKAPFISVSRTGKFIAGPLPLHRRVSEAPVTHTKPSTAGASNRSVLGDTNGKSAKGADVATTLPSVSEVSLTE